MALPTISAASSSAGPSPEAKTPAAAFAAHSRIWADRLAPAAAFVALIVVWEGACRIFAYSFVSVAVAKRDREGGS